LALQKSKFLSVEIQDALRFAIEKLSDGEYQDSQIPKPVNHHGDLISTPPKKSAAQKFKTAGPIRAADTNRTNPINFSQCKQNAARLKAL
jgi:hypothetical protein